MLNNFKEYENKYKIFFFITTRLEIFNQMQKNY